MCGIAGIWGDTGVGAVEKLQRMLGAMVHRGPDGAGALSFPGGAAGMVRLALVDLSERGQQPLWSPARDVALIFNGEMYNHGPHRRRLAEGGYPFTSATDAEVVLALYLERGEDFVHELRGMFALAIFDFRGGREQPRVTLARDPLGIKPLWIAESSGPRLVFASELRALLASGLVAREIDPEGLESFLAYGCVLQPRSILRGVRMLEAGTCEVFEPGRATRAWRFWQLPRPAQRVETLDVAAARLRATLEESVRIHAMADAPVGAFLSGGIDSTAIVALMRPHLPKLAAFTIRSSEGSDDETPAAVETARLLDCDVHVVDVRGAEVASVLPLFARDLDQPSNDGLNTWLVSRAAARVVKGALSGLGGDEFFAGYAHTRRMAETESLLRGRFAQPLARLLNRLVERAPAVGPRVRSMGSRASPLATWTHARTVFPQAELSGRPRGASPQSLIDGMLVTLTDDASIETPVSMACLLDAGVYMRSQLLRDSDATSMAHSLEVRFPLVDTEVATFARSCADDLKIRDGAQKRVLLRALDDLLPAHVRNGRKRGFSLPYREWLRGPLRSLALDAVSAETVRRRGLLREEHVAPVRQALLSGDQRFLYPQAWTLMMLELWCAGTLDAGSIAAPSLPIAAVAP